MQEIVSKFSGLLIHSLHYQHTYGEFATFLTFARLTLQGMLPCSQSPDQETDKKTSVYHTLSNVINEAEGIMGALKVYSYF